MRRNDIPAFAASVHEIIGPGTSPVVNRHGKAFRLHVQNQILTHHGEPGNSNISFVFHSPRPPLVKVTWKNIAFHIEIAKDKRKKIERVRLLWQSFAIFFGNTVLRIKHFFIPAIQDCLYINRQYSIISPETAGRTLKNSRENFGKMVAGGKTGA